MKLYRLDELSKRDAQHVFRQSRLTSVLISVIFLAGAVGLAWLILVRDGPCMLWAASAISFLIFLFTLGMAAAAFKKTNWLMKCGRAGLLIKFRSHLNHHFPNDQPTVVLIERSEIDSACKVSEVLSVPGVGGTRRGRGTRSLRCVYLELRLRHGNTDELADALRRERTMKAPKVGISRTKYHHYPVRLVNSSLIRVTWKSKDTFIRPGIEAALRTLGRIMRIDPEQQLGERRWQELQGAALDDFVLDLCERGDRMNAIKIVRERYGYGLTQAREFVDQLLGADASADRTDPADPSSS